MKLPALNAKKVIRVLKKAGFQELRQTGSHLVFANPQRTRLVVVPVHSGDLKKGLLFGIMKSAGLTQRQFVDFLSS